MNGEVVVEREETALNLMEPSGKMLTSCFVCFYYLLYY